MRLGVVLSLEEQHRLAAHSFRASFLAGADRRALLRELDVYVNR